MTLRFMFPTKMQLENETTCVPTQSARLTFIGEKLVLEKLESPLILFYFKREKKTRKKTLKK